ncbi:DUF2798 domain-containing protein [Ferrimonas lipolytica]|uniref:DUF2798 domain-containing protein n=1 Tax=Ferrimonas lipolytica TaxID=2724191 RepID=A0A6H1UDV1_9GAMM|nr:DUF2798 domain-containing protein [Ferrimonas lipolytica]QIZ76396.1 DUF2798 domain-containing protein [Ferrimonas lipolytica]
MTVSTLAVTNSTEQTKTPVFQKVLVVMALVIVIGGTLTGVMTYSNIGYTDSFYQSWLSAFVTTALVMMPTGVLMNLLLSKLATYFIPSASSNARNAVVGISMALIMESIMSFTTAIKNIGFTDAGMFMRGWLDGLLFALPLGLTLMLIMSMTVKPKVEAFLRS